MQQRTWGQQHRWSRASALLLLMLLASCHDSADLATRSMSTEASAAQQFATDLSGLVAPLVEAQGTLQNFALQLEDDLQQLEAKPLQTMIQAIAILFNALDSYVVQAIAAHDSDALTGFAWPEPIMAGDSAVAGINMRLFDNRLILTGTDIAASYDGVYNSIDAAMIIDLPSAQLSNDAIAFTLSDLRITDDYTNLIEAIAGQIRLSISQTSTVLAELNNDQPTERGTTLEILDGRLLLSNAIEIAGSGRLSIATDLMAGQFANAAYYNADMSLTGSLGNRSNDGFTAPLSAKVAFAQGSDWRGDLQGLPKHLSGQLKIGMTLSTASASPMIAGMVYDFFVPVPAHMSQLTTGDFDVRLQPNVSMTVGHCTFELVLQRAHEERLFQLNDANQETFAIALELNTDALADFDRDQLALGQITVNGQRQAELVLDFASSEVSARFPQGKSVTLIAAQQHAINSQ